MADKKISQLTAAATPLAGTEVLPIVQGGATVKVPVADLTSGRTVRAAALAVGTPTAAETLTVFSATNEFAIQWSGPGRAWVLASASNRCYIRNKTDSVVPITFLNEGNTGVGTSAPNAAAQLEVSSTTRGFLPPRMTTAQRDLIATPPDGLTLYNSSTSKLQVRAAGAWVDLH